MIGMRGPSISKPLTILPNGMLAKHTERIFADLLGRDPGVPEAEGLYTWQCLLWWLWRGGSLTHVERSPAAMCTAHQQPRTSASEAMTGRRSILRPATVWARSI